MEISQAKKRYGSQKRGAKTRGIAWEFDFQSWLEAWGDRLDKRGTGHDKLCMQRIGDKGPYSPSNIRIDYPRRNAQTRSDVSRNKWQASLDCESALCAGVWDRVESEELTDKEWIEYIHRMHSAWDYC